MKSMTRYLWFASVVIGLAFCLGCAQPGGENLATCPVSGTVTLKGEAVAGATVTFVPVDPEVGMTAIGQTDASGKYTLTTKTTSGALAGDYNVKIVKFETAAAAAGGGEYSDDAYTAAQAGADGPQEEAKPKNLLPEKYGDPAKSGLQATVSAGENTFDFPLEG